MTCATSRPSPLRCPTIEESVAATLALLPHGRAWQSNATAEQPYHDAAFDPAVFDPEIFDTESRPGTILYRYWRALATVRHFVESLLCALRLEMWCATHSQTHDEWMADYGLPDDCDPFPDLCTKVAAIGGARCEYFNAILARLGWSVTCLDASNGCGGRYGCADTRYGAASGYGALFRAQLTLLIDTANSPAYAGPALAPPVYGGGFTYGQPVKCAPDIGALRCLMERIAPAHVEVIYQAY